MTDKLCLRKNHGAVPSQPTEKQPAPKPLELVEGKLYAVSLSMRFTSLDDAKEWIKEEKKFDAEEKINEKAQVTLVVNDNCPTEYPANFVKHEEALWLSSK